MKVLIFGLGQLGTDLQSEFLLNGHDVAAYTKFGCDVTNYDQVKYVMKDTRADLVINCAAMHHLPQCEAFPTESHLVNVTKSRCAGSALSAATMGPRSTSLCRLRLSCISFQWSSTPIFCALPSTWPMRR